MNKYKQKNYCYRTPLKKLKRWSKKLVVYSLTVFIFAILIIFLANAFYKPSSVRLHQWRSPQVISKDELEIITWNLGYGGLGKDSNFVFDGGKDWLPKSKVLVEQNVSGIIDFLKSTTIKDKEWIIINLHLATFDSNAEVRAKQLQQIREIRSLCHRAISAW